MLKLCKVCFFTGLVPLDSVCLPGVPLMAVSSFRSLA